MSYTFKGKGATQGGPDVLVQAAAYVTGKEPQNKKDRPYPYSGI